LTSRRHGECPAEVAGHSSRLIVRSRPTRPDPNSNRGGWEPAGARVRHIHDTRGPADSHDTKPTVPSRPPYRRRRQQCGPGAYRTRRRSPSGLELGTRRRGDSSSSATRELLLGVAGGLPASLAGLVEQLLAEGEA